MILRAIYCTILIILINISVNAQVSEIKVDKPDLSEGQILIKKSKAALINGKIKEAVKLCKKAVKIEHDNKEAKKSLNKLLDWVWISNKYTDRYKILYK